VTASAGPFVRRLPQRLARESVERLTHDQLFADVRASNYDQRGQTKAPIQTPKAGSIEAHTNLTNLARPYMPPPLARRERAFLDQPLAEVNAMVEVDFQGDDCGPSGRRAADQHRALPAEMP
jgi:hypothetical protein